MNNLIGSPDFGNAVSASPRFRVKYARPSRRRGLGMRLTSRRVNLNKLINNIHEKVFQIISIHTSLGGNLALKSNPSTLRLVLLAGTNFSVLVVCCIWQVFILAFLR